MLATCSCVFAREPVRTRHAMVVTVEQHATDAGERVLENGGNAVDAAVAIGFTLAVTHPSAGNLGGGGFMLLRLADGRSTFIDFRERAPAAASHDMYLDAQRNPTKDSQIGYRASGIPGTVAGLAYAHAKFGKKPWATLVQPAVDVAKNGFPVSWGLSEMFTWDNVAEKLGEFPESKRIFLKGGSMLQAGDTLVQPELAATLERIRDQGANDFYRGQTAQLLAADMRAHGGLITAQDLADYKAIEREPAYRFLPRPYDCDGASTELGRPRHSGDDGYSRRNRLRAHRCGFRSRTAFPGRSNAALFRRQKPVYGRSRFCQSAGDATAGPASSGKHARLDPAGEGDAEQ